MSAIQTKAVLFDLDGTLVDTYPLLEASFKHAVNDVLGYDASADYFKATNGMPLDTQFLHYADNDEALRDRLSASYRAFNAINHDKLIREFPGMHTALRRLHAQTDARLGVVTSKMHAPALSGLAAFGYTDLFDCLVGSDDVSAHKPDPLPVLRGAELLGADPCSSIYVGDSPYDIQAGNAAGATTVAVLWGVHDEEVLRAAEPTMVCADIDSLADMLLGAL